MDGKSLACTPRKNTHGAPLAWTRKPDFVNASSLPPEDLIFGATEAMRVVREKIERTARTAVPVLLQGESGTGKEIFAQLIHLRSDRSMRPYVRVNCPALPGSLVESELFGYERGAFTGAHASRSGRVELAHRGSLLLDEVGSLENGSQAKLLQVLQDGTFMRVGAQQSRSVDTRLICTANGNLRDQVGDGSFRLDLFFRISAITINLPPLRQRVADIPLLIDHFLDTYSKRFMVEPKPLSRQIRSLMEQYNWPGNIRQLENVVRNYVLLGDEEALCAELFPDEREAIVPEIDLSNPISLKEITKAATRNLEREIILKVLRANGWSRQKAARWLNISYRSLLYKMQDCGVGSEVSGYKGNPVLTGTGRLKSGLNS